MAIKNVKLKNGEDVLYPKTKISNILNEDGTTWKEKVIEPNPSGEATTDLTKIKIADTIYRLASVSSGSGGSGTLEILIPTLSYETSGVSEVIQGTLTEEEVTKINNGQIYGLLVTNDRYAGLCTYYAQERSQEGTSTYFICNTLLSDIMSAMGEGEGTISGILILIVIGNNIQGFFVKSLNTALIPPLPSDASNKTYVLKSVNGKLTWSE